MGAREFLMVKGAMLRIDPLAGDSLRVRSGEVWVTQHADSRDYMLRTGDSLALNSKGPTLAVAYRPTLLDLFRKDPAGVRCRSEREARHGRLHGVRTLLRKVWRTLTC
jgi:Protein of unknown function (DUF2917)